jgi:hypothetical protein
MEVGSEIGDSSDETTSTAVLTSENKNHTFRLSSIRKLTNTPAPMTYL